jgi:hypothetical protein
MVSYPKTPFGWKRVYTKEAGWITPEVQTAAADAVVVEDKTWPVAEYPGWAMSLNRSVVDPKLWLLTVSYAPDGKTMSPDTLIVFARNATEQPKMPVSFAWGTTKWWLLGAGIAVLAVAAVVLWKRRGKRKARPRRRVKAALPSPSASVGLPVGLMASRG